MNKLPLIATLAALAAAAAAVAQTQTSNPGFFSPTPDGDVAITKVVPPKAPAAETVATEVERIEAERVAALRKAEEEMDRSEREAAAERLRTQPTSERDR